MTLNHHCDTGTDHKPDPSPDSVLKANTNPIHLTLTLIFTLTSFCWPCALVSASVFVSEYVVMYLHLDPSVPGVSACVYTYLLDCGRMNVCLQLLTVIIPSLHFCIKKYQKILLFIRMYTSPYPRTQMQE
jgi:hypothetical protein